MLNGGRDKRRARRYMQTAMTRAATYYGFWFSYPLFGGGRDARLV